MAYNFYIRVIIVSSFANLVKIIVLIHSFVKVDFTYAIMLRTIYLFREDTTHADVYFVTLII